VHEPLTKLARAPALVLGPSLTVEYRTIVVPVTRSNESEEALVAAARLAAERRATVAIVSVVEIPLELPPDSRVPELEADANEVLDNAQALLESYEGVRAVSRLVRARSAGPAIVREAVERDAELIVLGAARHRGRGGAPVFGKTVDYVLKEAPCRVLVAAGRKAA
jgi:APA family basic amino acid/polyamine antiporter